MLNRLTSSRHFLRENLRRPISPNVARAPAHDIAHSRAVPSPADFAGSAASSGQLITAVPGPTFNACAVLSRPHSFLLLAFRAPICALADRSNQSSLRAQDCCAGRARFLDRLPAVGAKTDPPPRGKTKDLISELVHDFSSRSPITPKNGLPRTGSGPSTMRHNRKFGVGLK